MEDFGFANILSRDKIDDLFGDDVQVPEEKEDNREVVDEETEESDENEHEETTEVTEDDLFNDDSKEPESVGSKEDTGEKGDSSTDDSGGTSPDDNFYSSITSAMAEDGIFPNLDTETLEGVKDAETFSALFDKEVEARLDDIQKRIKKALDNGVEPTTVRVYENTLKNLSAIKESDLKAEDEKGETLRYQLIRQDFLNNGYSEERADKLARRSIDNGTDLDDAKEALQSNKEYFQKKYQKLLDEAEDAANQEREETKRKAEKLKNSLLTDKQVLGDIEVSAEMRKKALEKVTKPVYKDPETGEYMTAVQRYEMEHGEDFLKYVGLVMAMTNDFKDFKQLVKAEVKKEKKKGLLNLESKLQNTRRDKQGNLRMVTSVTDDPESTSSRMPRLAL